MSSRLRMFEGAVAALCMACGTAAPTAQTAVTAAAEPSEHDKLLACLRAPPTTIFEPKRLATEPTAGLAVHTFVQQTPSCGPVERRYVVYVPDSVGPSSGAPVVIVLHGQGASAEVMRDFQTRKVFEALAREEQFLVVYGNGLPTGFNVEGLPNSGRWRSEYTDLGDTVDEIEYLRRIVDDLATRELIAGGNDVYLVGQSNGGGMVLSAARQRPEDYAGVAAFMPFVGFTATAPETIAGRLRRVLFAYSDADPALPATYSTHELAPLAMGWARALGVPSEQITAASATATALPDRVIEGEGTTVTGGAVDATRNSRAKQLDLRADSKTLRVLSFDRAGHFWPTHEYADPQPMLLQYGLRNQDIDGARETWRFFRSE